MRYRLVIAVMLVCLGLVNLPLTAAGQSSITASNNQATLNFPGSITFSIDLKSDSEIRRVVLEYGVQQLTCGTVIGKAVAQITPGTQVTARWTWEMKQSGSEPPGSTVWWRWRITTADGKETALDQKTITWIDEWRNWQVISTKDIVLHWYTGDKTFATDLQNAALKALTDLSTRTSLKPDGTIDVYVYANTQDLLNAILYTPDWTGARAFPENNIVAMGVAPADLAWGKQAIAHELTHILVGRYAFTCLGEMPVWLDEGIAMYGEGGPDATSQKLFQTAVTNNTIFSVRSLNSNFPEDAAQANLAYSQSFSLVNFLMSEYGSSKLTLLLGALRDGAIPDTALQSTYGFDSNGLEDAWRAKIGAKPRRATSSSGTMATPTTVPTFLPIAGLQFPTRTPTPIPPTATATPTATPTATAMATATATETPVPSTPTPTPRVEATAALTDPTLLIGGAIGLIVIVLVVMVIARRKKG